MTETTVPPASASTRTVRVEESFSRYRFDAAAVSGRTDTPDLMRVFRDEELLAEAYEANQAEVEAAHADLAATSFKTLPGD